MAAPGEAAPADEMAVEAVERGVGVAAMEAGWRAIETEEAAALAGAGAVVV